MSSGGLEVSLSIQFKTYKYSRVYGKLYYLELLFVIECSSTYLEMNFLYSIVSMQ